MFRGFKSNKHDAALEKRVQEMEKELEALKQWRKEVSDTLGRLGLNNIKLPDTNSPANTTSDKGHPAPLLKQSSWRDPVPPPLWFCSYCWLNSQSALMANEVKRAVGKTDPREVWRVVSKTKNLPGWLDKEFLGKEGLFDEIVEGLLDAKVMVAFVSNEYADSENCLAELTFAKKCLRIPVIPVVVGTGWEWRSTKAGLLLADSLYIDMTKEETYKDKLKELVDRLSTLVGSEASEKAYLEQTGQVATLDDVKVGDAVEKRANDPLNFSAQFQRYKIKEDDSGHHLASWYWWPCEVIDVNDEGGFKLHYWGYGNDWDCWVTKEEREKQIRPLQYPTLNLGTVNPGDPVEVRLFQDTRIEDKNSSKAYCWTTGTVIASDDISADVKLDLDLSRFQNGTMPPYDENKDNCFHFELYGNSVSGFDKVNVSVAALRRI